MPLRAWIDSRSILKESGLVLAGLNLAMAFACVVTFFGVLAGTLALSLWLRSFTGNPDLFVPFPAYVLLLLYVVAFLAMWIRFARGLLPSTRSRAVRTGLVGATPLFGVALLGYVSVVGTLILGDFGPNSMLEATVFIYAALSTLVLLAGLCCIATVAWFGPHPHST